MLVIDCGVIRPQNFFIEDRTMYKHMAGKRFPRNVNSKHLWWASNESWTSYDVIGMRIGGVSPFEKDI